MDRPPDGPAALPTRRTSPAGTTALARHGHLAGTLASPRDIAVRRAARRRRRTTTADERPGAARCAARSRSGATRRSRPHAQRARRVRRALSTPAADRRGRRSPTACCARTRCAARRRRPPTTRPADGPPRAATTSPAPSCCAGRPRRAAGSLPATRARHAAGRRHRPRPAPVPAAQRRPVLTVYGAAQLDLSASSTRASRRRPGPPTACSSSVFLAGGVDSLSVLAPVGDPQLPRPAAPARAPGLERDAVRRGRAPALASRPPRRWPTLHGEGKSTVMPAIGYDHPDQSHFTRATSGRSAPSTRAC